MIFRCYLFFYLKKIIYDRLRIMVLSFFRGILRENYVGYSVWEFILRSVNFLFFFKENFLSCL